MAGSEGLLLDRCRNLHWTLRTRVEADGPKMEPFSKG